MIWKKTWFNFLIWTLFTVASAFLLTLGARELFLRFFGLSDVLYYIGGVCLCLLLGAGLFFVIRMASLAVAKRDKEPLILPFITCFIVIFAFAFCIYYRLLCIYNMVTVDDLAMNRLVTDGYVGTFNAGLFNGRFADFAFSGIMFGVYSFLGNHAYLAILVQLALLIIAYLFIILGISNFTGKAGTVAYAACGLCLMGQSLFSVYLDSFWVFFLVFAICFFWMSILFKSVSKKKAGAGTIVGAVILALIVGFITYVNLFGILLLFLALTLGLLATENGKSDQIPHKKAICAILTLVPLVPYAALTYFFGVDTAIKLDVPAIRQIVIFPVDTAVIALVALIGVFIFFSTQMLDYGFGGMVIFLISCVFGFTDIYDFSSPALVYMGLIIGAAMCFGSAFNSYRKPEVITVTSETETVVEVDLDKNPEDIAVMAEETPVEEPVEEVAAEEAVIEEAPAEETPTEETPAEEAPVEEVKEKPPVPRFFKSPIKEPKKHEPKTIDYDHEFSEELLKDYDISVADDDDYDI